MDNFVSQHLESLLNLYMLMLDDLLVSQVIFSMMKKKSKIYNYKNRFYSITLTAIRTSG
jgi:hypothetical protein